MRITSNVLGKIMMIKLNLKSYETPMRFCNCCICHRLTSKGHTELLFMDGDTEVRVCYLCNHA